MTDRELLPLLAAAETGDEDALRRWPATTTDDCVNDTLHRIACLAIPTALSAAIWTVPLTKIRGKRQYCRGRFALLLLAEHGDMRALPLLMSEWQAHPSTTQRAWNGRVAATLTSLLDTPSNLTLSNPLQERLRAVGKKLLLTSNENGFAHDLSHIETYLAIAIVRQLHRGRAMGNIEFLQRASERPGGTPWSNRAMVREIITLLLQSGRSWQTWK